MDVGQIEALVQVAQHQSFSKAAESLYLTQPSVTARIQALEKELAEELFERTGRGVRLTDAGHAFLPFAERILAALQEGRESVEEVRSLQIGSLRLGVAPTLCTYVLPRTLKAFRNRYPTGENYVVADDVGRSYEREHYNIKVKFVSLKDLIKTLSGQGEVKERQPGAKLKTARKKK